MYDMNCIGYVLFADYKAEDYTSQWINDEDVSSVCCKNENCQALVDQNYNNGEFKFNKRSSDLYFVHFGGIYLVSNKFKEFIEKNRIDGVEFIAIQNNNDYYRLNILGRLEVDESTLDKSNTCPDCGRSISTSMSKAFIDIGNNKVLKFLKNNQPITEGVYYTNVKYGNGTNYAPLIVVGIKTMERMKDEGLKYIVFKEIVS